MTEKFLIELLRGYKNNSVSESEIVARIKNFSTEDLGFANVDHHRELRQGFPEVIYAAGKTKEQVREIFKRLYERSDGNLIATRASREKFEYVAEEIHDAQYNDAAQMIYVDRKNFVRDESRTILILTAGTSDLPVAEEARLTAYLFGNAVKIFHDCGVAGIHRLFAHMKDIEQASVIIVVAGMEGALASVVGGLTDKPIIAVPTSIGYGASFNGIAALLSMLNSCAAGISVVNIDNGFGAAVAASKIIKVKYLAG